MKNSYFLIRGLVIIYFVKEFSASDSEGAKFICFPLLLLYIKSLTLLPLFFEKSPTIAKGTRYCENF